MMITAKCNVHQGLIWASEMTRPKVCGHLSLCAFLKDIGHCLKAVLQNIRNMDRKSSRLMLDKKFRINIRFIFAFICIHP